MSETLLKEQQKDLDENKGKLLFFLKGVAFQLKKPDYQYNPTDLISWTREFMNLYGITLLKQDYIKKSLRNLFPHYDDWALKETLRRLLLRNIQKEAK